MCKNHFSMLGNMGVISPVGDFFFASLFWYVLTDSSSVLSGSGWSLLSAETEEDDDASLIVCDPIGS